MAIDLPGGSGFPQSHTDSGQALRKLAGLFPLTRQNIANDAVGPDQIDGTWTTWTPTWTNLTVGDGTTSAKYLSLGGVMFFKLLFTFGSTSAISGSVALTLPVTAASPILRNVAQVAFFDANTFAIIYGVVQQSSATSIGLFSMNAAGTFVIPAALSATQPFTWAVSDTISLQGWVELP